MTIVHTKVRECGPLDCLSSVLVEEVNTISCRKHEIVSAAAPQVHLLPLLLFDCVYSAALAILEGSSPCPTFSSILLRV